MLTAYPCSLYEYYEEMFVMESMKHVCKLLWIRVFVTLKENGIIEVITEISITVSQIHKL